jgi:hypothetical protein
MSTDKVSGPGAASAAAAAAAAGQSLLSAAILKGLSDKLYEKRKNAALEIEKCVCSLCLRGVTLLSS